VRTAVAQRRRVALVAAGTALELREHQRRRRARTSILPPTPCSTIFLSFRELPFGGRTDEGIVVFQGFTRLTFEIEEAQAVSRS
jgi:hypothetical protein